MIAFPGMLVGPAKAAGMKVPEDPENFVAEEYVRFQIYLAFQLGAPLPYPSAHWDNAKIIAELTDEDLQKVTVGEMMERLALGYPTP
jgi:hypothetical protein